MDDNLSSCLAFRLGAAFRRADRHCNRALAAIDLTHAHAQVLACLLDRGELRVTDIARHTGFEQSTTSRLAQDLARRRMLRRRRHPEDRRAMLLRPATRAVRLRGVLRDILRRADERLHGNCSESDLEAFTRVVEALKRMP